MRGIFLKPLIENPIATDAILAFKRVSNESRGFCVFSLLLFLLSEFDLKLSFSGFISASGA